MPRTEVPPNRGRRRPTILAQRNSGELRQVTAWVDKELWRCLKLYAMRHETTVSALLSEAIEQHLRPLTATWKAK